MNRLIIMLILVFTITTNAQNIIQGKIIDNDTQQPIEFADVLISGETLEYPLGTSTDMNGNFELMIKNGVFQLKVLFVGQELMTREIEMNDKSID